MKIKKLLVLSVVPDVQPELKQEFLEANTKLEVLDENQTKNAYEKIKQLQEESETIEKNKATMEEKNKLLQERLFLIQQLLKYQLIKPTTLTIEGFHF